MDHKPEPIRPGYKFQDDSKVYLSLTVLFIVLLSSANSGTKKTAAILLTIITVFQISPTSYSGYLAIRNLGLFNTVYGIIAVTCFSSAAVWAMVCVQRDDRRTTGKSYLLSCLAIFFIQAALAYGNSAIHIVYLNRPEISPLLILRFLYASISIGIENPGYEPSGNNGIFSLYGFIASLLPLAHVPGDLYLCAERQADGNNMCRGKKSIVLSIIYEDRDRSFAKNCGGFSGKGLECTFCLTSINRQNHMVDKAQIWM